MAADRVFDVHAVERIYTTYRVSAESADEAESIVRANARDDLAPREEEVGSLSRIDSVIEVGPPPSQNPGGGE